ncbi:MAG: hypothetical protein BGO67_01715 [Alphaproteobacteria bacterium 41-28]|nr:MAG: hypothetical protein BGO67_01715 [Alphaproteobacteria bacterium 41-28]
MEFEWDSKKNKNNIEKHGIDFADAALIFDEDMLVYEDVREDYGEKRFCGIGVLEKIEIFVSYTLRGEKVRIISARKARKDERQKYSAIYAAQSSEGKYGLG